MRLFRVLAVSAAVLAVLAGPAPSQAEDADDPCAVATARAEVALDRIEVPLPGRWTITLACGRPSDRAGYARNSEKSITVYPEHHQTVEEVSWSILHEIGHAYDRERLSDDARDGWAYVRGLPEGAWRRSFKGLDAAQWLAIPAEDFAESFAYCQTGGPVRVPQSYQLPTVRQCGLMQYLTGVPSQI